MARRSKVIIDVVGGKASFTVFTDSNGFVRIYIDSYANQQGKLIVEAFGFKTYTDHLDLTRDTLPHNIILSQTNLSQIEKTKWFNSK